MCTRASVEKSRCMIRSPIEYGSGGAVYMFGIVRGHIGSKTLKFIEMLRGKKTWWNKT